MPSIPSLYPKFDLKSSNYYEPSRISGKQILASYGVRIQRGIAQTSKEAVDVAKQLTEETGMSWRSQGTSACRWPR